MRRVLERFAVLLVLSVLATPAGAVTFLEEHFDGSFPPAGWSAVDWWGSGVVWTNIQGSLESFNYTGGRGNAASVSVRNFPTPIDGYGTYLDTPSIALPGTPGNKYLHFRANFQEWAEFSDRLYFEYTTDAGENWYDLALYWNSTHGAFAEQPGYCANLNVTSQLGSATSVIIRFHYWDFGNNYGGYYAQIDDVVLDDVPTAPCPQFVDGFDFGTAPWTATSPALKSGQKRGKLPREGLHRKAQRRLDAESMDDGGAARGKPRALKRSGKGSLRAAPDGSSPSRRRPKSPAPVEGALRAPDAGTIPLEASGATAP